MNLQETIKAVANGTYLEEGFNTYMATTSDGDMVIVKKAKDEADAEKQIKKKLKLNAPRAYIMSKSEMNADDWKDQAKGAKTI